MDTTKPEGFRCDCSERISLSEAYELIREKKAEWVVGDRGGKPYVYRNAIIIRQTVDEAIEFAADRAAAHTAELEHRDAERKQAARQKQVAKIIKQFRDKLRPDENAQWSDDQIVGAFETRDPAFMDLPFMGGVGAKQKLENATTKEIVEQRSFFQELADSARIYAAFYHAVLNYWNKVKLIADHGLSDNRGQYLTKAPKGKGELVSGGYGDEKLALVDAHREENADGQRRCDVANFRKGAGGLEVTVDGEIVEADPVYSGGTDPIQYEEGNETKAKRLREKWLEDQCKREA